MGLNGVDNAKLTFNNVRVPKDNLLNKYSDVGDDGKFHSTILRSLKQILGYGNMGCQIFQGGIQSWIEKNPYSKEIILFFE